MSSTSAIIRIHDRFWAGRQAVVRDVTIPLLFARCRAHGCHDSLSGAWRPGPPVGGGLGLVDRPWGWLIRDSDLAKTVDAACLALAQGGGATLAPLIDEAVGLFVGAQRADGYLNSYISAVCPELRWSNLREAHELYCAGHLMEAAVSHHRATGDERLLGTARRLGDHIAATFGTGPGQRRGYDGHPLIEMALVALAGETREQRYLDLARFFIDERGREPSWFDVEARARGEDPRAWHRFHDGNREGYAYMQAHRPVREQDRLVGHAVRAFYLYAGMADLARLDGDRALADACRRLWSDVTREHLYVHGGVGNAAHNEGVDGRRRRLPNGDAYCETCAAVGLVFWARRMLRLERDAAYAEVLELALHNCALASLSWDGRRFLYQNRPAVDEQPRHVDWYGFCPCCPPNIARLIADVGSYVSTVADDGIDLHLLVGCTIEAEFAGRPARLRIDAEVPWSGGCRIEVLAGEPFTLRVRAPSWAADPSVRLAGRVIQPPRERGYLVLAGVAAGSVIEIGFALTPQRVYAHPDVLDDAGRVALRHGPFLHCVEDVDHGCHPERLALPRAAPLAVVEGPAALGGMPVLRATAERAEAHDDELYSTRAPIAATQPLTAIPYCCWDHRGGSGMRIWMREQA